MKNAGLGEKITSYPLAQPLALGLSCHMLLQVKTLGQQELEVLCSVISGHFLVSIMKWALVCVSQTKILMDWTGFCTIFSLQTAIEVDIVLYLFIDNLKLGLVCVLSSARTHSSCHFRYCFHDECDVEKTRLFIFQSLFESVFNFSELVN